MIRDFVLSVTTYAKALQFIRQHRLWSYFIIPGLLASIILLALFAALIYFLADPFGTWLTGFLGFLPESFLDRIDQYVGGIILGVFGMIVYKHLVIALLSPFMSHLSDRVETILYPNNPTAKLTVKRAIYEFYRGLRIALSNVIREILLVLFLLILGLFPIFSLFTTILIYLVQAYFAGFGNMDYTLERHYNVSESRRFVRSNRGLALGNGVLFLLLIPIPVVGILLGSPIATVASTLNILPRIPEVEESNEVFL